MTRWDNDLPNNYHNLVMLSHCSRPDEMCVIVLSVGFKEFPSALSHFKIKFFSFSLFTYELWMCDRERFKEKEKLQPQAKKSSTEEQYVSPKEEVISN